MQQWFPYGFAFAHDSDIEISMLQKKVIVGRDLRSAQYNGTKRQFALELSGQEEASLNIPLVTADPDQNRASIDQKPENGLITAVGHDRARHQLHVDILLCGNRLQIGSRQRDVLITEEKVVSLNGKLQ